MAYNTGNAIGSADARDLYDNATNLDKAMNSGDATWVDRFGVARPTFKGAESELNQKVEDAETAATQALGYLNTMRATSYGPLAEDPTTDPLGNACTAGDEYFNTTYSLLKRFDGALWRVPDINTTDLASGAGSSMVGHGGQTVETALNERLPEIGTYALLRAYTGPVTAFFVRGVANIFDGGFGVFRVDAADTTTADNGGTVLVDGSERRWKRDYSGAVNIKWFDAKGDDPAFDNYDAIKAACAAIEAAGGGTLVIPEGRTYYVNRHRIDNGPSANGVTNFAFEGIDGLVIDGCGSKIVMQGGWTRTADYTAGAWTYSYHNCIGFDFAGCTNLVIKNLELDGGAATVVKEAAAEGWSYGIIIGGCDGVTLENVSVHHYTSDGLYITSYGPSTNYVTTKHVTAINCKFKNNARQACSILQVRWATFINCEFSYSGQAGGYGGHSPQAGVDIEPNYYPGMNGTCVGDEFAGDITFIGGKFLDNNGFEFIATNYISTPHPVQFFGTTFKNTNNINPQITPAVKTCRFISCNFDNVAWYPSYALDQPTLSEFLYCNLTWSRDAVGVLFGYQNPTLKITSCRLNFTGTTPRTGANYPISLQASKAYLRDNDIFFSAALHGGTTYHAIASLKYLAESVGNRFSTDLADAGKFFQLDYSSAVTLDDAFVTTGKFSPLTTPWSLDFIARGNKNFNALVSAYGTKITYGTAAPTTGTWARGDQVWSTTPAAGGSPGWVCVTGGTPGTWKAMANLAA